MILISLGSNQGRESTDLEIFNPAVLILVHESLTRSYYDDVIWRVWRFGYFDGLSQW